MSVKKPLKSSLGDRRSGVAPTQPLAHRSVGFPKRNVTHRPPHIRSAGMQEFLLCAPPPDSWWVSAILFLYRNRLTFFPSFLMDFLKKSQDSGNLGFCAACCSDE